MLGIVAMLLLLKRSPEDTVWDGRQCKSRADHHIELLSHHPGTGRMNLVSTRESAGCSAANSLGDRSFQKLIVGLCIVVGDEHIVQINMRTFQLSPPTAASSNAFRSLRAQLNEARIIRNQQRLESVCKALRSALRRGVAANAGPEANSSAGAAPEGTKLAL